MTLVVSGGIDVDFNEANFGIVQMGRGPFGGNQNLGMLVISHCAVSCCF
jgi:methylglyoxal synthase